jgi:hypothetical protein
VVVMKKNYFKFSLTLNVIFALIAVAFSLIFYVSASSLNDSQGVYTFLSYVKNVLDFLAVFVGYATVIYAFAKLDFVNGVISIGTFSISVLISFLYRIIANIVSSNSMTDFLADQDVLSASELYTIMFYSSFGQDVFKQLIPAIIIAIIVYMCTKNGTQRIKKLFSWENKVQKAMILSTLIVFVFQLLIHTGLNVLPSVLPELIDVGSISATMFEAVLISYIDVIIFYLIMPYFVYYFMFNIYDNYVIKHPDKTIKETI